MSKKNLGPVGSAVLPFVGYKQTDKPNLYIDGTHNTYILIFKGLNLIFFILFDLYFDLVDRKNGFHKRP